MPKLNRMSETTVLSKILQSSPCIELLRMRSRELTVVFLYETFYLQRNAVSYENLCKRLTDYLTDLNIENDEENGIQLFDTFEEKARKYIQRWTDKGFLCNYQEESGEVFYELSSYSSKTIDWLLSLKRESFVGTESKFMNLFGQLQELVEFTNENQEERIRLLEAKKQEIEHQIQCLKAGENAKVFEEYQILPRFREITRSAKELLSDFKEVEDNFKTITKSIYQKQTEGNSTKGDILGFTFEALEQLQQSPQGKSFYAFWNFLLTPSMQETWDELVENLYGTFDNKQIEIQDRFLKNMKQYLYTAGKKVYQANDRMAEKLSRIICEKSPSDLATTQRLIQDIQATLLHLAGQNIKPDISLEVETSAEISLPFERKLTLEQPREITYRQALEMAESDIMQAQHADNLFSQYSIDRNLLKQNIRQVLKRKRQASLGEIVERSGGLEKGLAELFGYIGVVKSFRYAIHPERTQTVVFNPTENKSIIIPEIIVLK